MSRGAGIAALGVKALSKAYREGDLSPTDVLDAYVERIEAFNPALNAFLGLRIEAARQEAQAAAARWAAGKPCSPLDGVPYGVKANIAVKGLPWHAGIGAYRERIASENAACIDNLDAGGAVALGILNMHEGALGATTDNPHFGRCCNPWDAARTPGGSSGGSGAAVAAGLCAFALGTDTMGSIRIPSAYCGIAGHKPSYGLVRADGVVDLSPTLDHVGPHARHAEDLALILPVLSGRPLASPSKAMRIGVASWAEGVEATSHVMAGFDAARRMLETMGAVKPVDLSSFEFGALRRKGLLVSEVEGFAVHEKALADNPGGFSDEFRGMLEWGARQPKEKVESAYASVRAAGQQLGEMFAEHGVDVIVAPTAPQGPFPFAAPVPANQADFTAMANFGGLPATAVPSSVEGAPPPSMQFIAAKGMDHTALAAAMAFERIRGPAPRPSEYF